MLDMTDLPRALEALAEAFDREADAIDNRIGDIFAAEATIVRREATGTRLMASLVREELDSEPDPEQLASAHAWLTSGTERVQMMQARRHARELRTRAL